MQSLARTHTFDIENGVKFIIFVTASQPEREWIHARHVSTWNGLALPSLAFTSALAWPQPLCSTPHYNHARIWLSLRLGCQSEDCIPGGYATTILPFWFIRHPDIHRCIIIRPLLTELDRNCTAQAIFYLDWVELKCVWNRIWNPKRIEKGPTLVNKLIWAGMTTTTTTATFLGMSRFYW